MLPALLNSFVRRTRRGLRKLPKAASAVAHSIKKKMGDRSPTPFDDDSSGGCFAKALEARGISYEYLHRHQTPIGSTPHRKYLVFRVNGVAHYFSHGSLLVGNTDGSVGPSVNGAIGPLLAQKDLTNSVLRGHGFSVPEGLAFHRDSTDEACGYFAALAATAARGVCVKPANGRKGHKVHVGLRDLPSFRSAFELVAKHYERVLIEETVEGTVLSLLLPRRARDRNSLRVACQCRGRWSSLHCGPGATQEPDACGHAFAPADQGQATRGTDVSGERDGNEYDSASRRDRMARPNIQSASRRRHDRRHGYGTSLLYRYRGTGRPTVSRPDPLWRRCCDRGCIGGGDGIKPSFSRTERRSGFRRPSPPAGGKFSRRGRGHR